MAGPKEQVEVNWRECSRTVQEMRKLAPEDEQAAFDLAKPEESAWVQEILREATCGDLERSVCAFWRFVNIFSKLVNEQGKAKAAETASYLLQRRFGEELHAGLKDAKSSGVCFLLPKSDGISRNFFINRVDAYASVLSLLTVDERTAKFFLTEMEALLMLLEGLFHQAAHPSLAKLTPFIGLDQDPASETRRAIIRAVASIIDWSKRASRFMIERKELYLEMVKESTAKLFRSGDPSKTDYLMVTNYGLALIGNLHGKYSPSEQRSMLDEVLHLVATTLVHSDCAPVLQSCLYALWNLKNRIGQEEVCSYLRSYEGLPESFAAIAACTAYSNRSWVRSIAVNFAFEVRIRIDLPDEVCPDSGSITEEQGLELCRLLGDHNPTIKCRVERLTAASEDPIYKNTPVLKRKCSNPACENREPESERFKMCRGCLLEIYCSAGE